MLEIAFDKNNDNKFLNQTRPVIMIENEQFNNFSDYCLFADNILKKYENDQIILIRNNSEKCSSNLLAVALFVSSCLIQTKTECAVFKVHDYENSLKNYKPYVALTIALKYAIRLFNLKTPEIYKEIANMSYLGIYVKRDYLNNSILLGFNENLSEPDVICNNLKLSIIQVATLKALALLNTKNDTTVKIEISKTDNVSDINDIINQIVENVTKKIS